MLDNLTTEGRNPASEAIDSLSAYEIARLMNSEDARVSQAVAQAIEPIAQGIEVVADRLRRGGRLIYIGAGTSGRLGVLDASECPPTFNTRPDQVVGLIAGGRGALTQAIEGAEDNPERGAEDLRAVDLSANDVLVGIATSGRTPYVIGGLQFARNLGAFAIGLACNADSEIAMHSDVMITVVVGPEIVSGSTRLKAGTATKLVLNMLTTGAMVLLGKTYGNLMVDLRATNTKLVERTRRIVMMLTDLSHDDAEAVLSRCDGELKTAIVTHKCDIEPTEARQRLDRSGGHLRQALELEQIADELKPSVKTAESDFQGNDLVFGLDGGGTKTVAWLATRGSSQTTERLGEGRSGPSNPQAVGFSVMAENLDRAIHQAFQTAGITPQPVAALCLALAGSDRENVKSELDRWAEARGVSDRTQWIHDGMATLWAGCPDGCGIALIAGTGSLAFGRNQMGQTVRCGGWGYLIGDEGSGYAIAQAGLRAVTKAIDGRGAATTLQPALFASLGIKDPRELVTAVYRTDSAPSSIAACAERVLLCAEEGDEVAGQIVRQAACELALKIETVADKIGLSGSAIPLALGGGLLVGTAVLRDALLQRLELEGIAAESVNLVTEQVAGAVAMARDLVSATR
jgi:N-acetylmuramic acid 6-phosphate etherase